MKGNGEREWRGDRIINGEMEWGEENGEREWRGGNW